MRRHAVRRPRRRAIAAAAIGLLTVGIGAAVGLISGIAARTIITPPSRKAETTQVLRVDIDEGLVTFTRTADSAVGGRYGFWFTEATGYALVGTIVAETERTVTRELLDVYLGELTQGVWGRFGAWFYLNPSDAGEDYSEVQIATDLGPAPAWQIVAPGQTGKWVIMVHGRAVVRAECVRAIGVFRAAGYNSLLISYRNDGEAPQSPDGLYALGDTEWKDVDSAIEYAQNRGARSIVLMGWSMGGATALQTVTRSAHSRLIVGVALDSPVVDWKRALDFQGKEKGLIRPVRAIVFALLGSAWARPITGQREPINLGRLDFVRRARELSVPILILHSDDDKYIPSTASRLLARERPDIVTLEVFTTAAHTRLWNYDEQRWNSAVNSWLDGLVSTDVSSGSSNARRVRRMSR